MALIRYVQDDDANAGATDALARARASRGSVSLLLRALAHSPSALDAFVSFSAHVNGESVLDPKVRELVVLRVAQQIDNVYEWQRHVPKALSLGIDVQLVESLLCWRAYERLDEQQAAALGLVDDLIDDWQIEGSTGASLVAAFESEEIVELLLTVGWYLLAGTLIRSLGLSADDPEPPGLAVPHSPVPRARVTLPAGSVGATEE